MTTPERGVESVPKVRSGILSLVVAAAALTILGVREAQAAPGGCVASAPAGLDNGTIGAMKCIWTSNGTMGAYLAGTANPWKISVSRRVGAKWRVVHVIEGGGGQTTQPAGQLSLKPGDRVTAEIRNLCGPSFYYYDTPCAAAGFVAVMNG